MKKKTLFNSKFQLHLRNMLMEGYIWSMAVYGAENWTHRKLDQKYFESFEIR